VDSLNSTQVRFARPLISRRSGRHLAPLVWEEHLAAHYIGKYPNEMGAGMQPVSKSNANSVGMLTVKFLHNSHLSSGIFFSPVFSLRNVK
jgi:hypothetical protein